MLLIRQVPCDKCNGTGLNQETQDLLKSVVDSQKTDDHDPPEDLDVDLFHNGFT